MINNIMTKVFLLPLTFVLCFLLIPQNSEAHSGRTDKNGGHWDRKKGTYHYHNTPKAEVDETKKNRSSTRHFRKK